MSILNRIIEKRKEREDRWIINELNNCFQRVKGLEDSNIVENIIKKSLDLSLYDEYELYTDCLGKSIYIGRVVELSLINDLWVLREWDDELLEIISEDIKKELSCIRGIGGVILNLNGLSILRVYSV